ncbi:MAG: hypothetical protein JNK58_11955 [Phycisphaerae bacterium]|nr:hypothetical protein [Phycisphaerae bacterium]
MTQRMFGILTLSGLVILAGPSLAQQPAPAPAPGMATGVTQASTPAPTPDPRADVSFAGGTAQQYVDAIGKAFGAANAAVAPEAASIAVAPVQLKSVTRHDAMTLLQALASGRVAVMPRGDTFMVLSDRSSEEQRLETPIIRVWPLEKVLARMKPEEALSAVQAALELAGEGAAVKFHADTSLLIIRGTGRQIDAVSQVVDRLENVAGYREGEAERADAGKTSSGLEEQVRALRAEVQELRENVNQALSHSRDSDKR